ncbi:MAG: fibro-slime domain-containing protein [Polyangiaceae bacterium]
MRVPDPRAWALVLALSLAGCGARSELAACERGQVRTCESFCGQGIQRCVQGEWTECSTRPPEGEVSLPATVRDFRSDHPDFEADVIGDDPGIVAPLLGPDGKPVYAGTPSTPTTTGQANFDQWFRDVPSVNQRTEILITLVGDGGDPPVYRFDSPNFFPIDGQLFGDEDNPHNFHFTLEMVVDFKYSGGERFIFRGDDDVFAYLNGHLAIDLGGVHGAESATVDLDSVAEPFGLIPGEVFPLALFFAERHTSGSSFYIETTIADFDVCPDN